MKTALQLFALSLALIQLCLIACDSVTVDPTGMGINVQFNQASTTQGPADLQFTEGFLRLSELEFEGERKDGGEIELEIDQLTTIDLATGVATPPLPGLSIPAGVYEELELEVAGADDGTVLFLKGTFMDSLQNQTPIEVDIRKEFSLEMEWENYTIDSTISFGASFLIDPLIWFQTISAQDLYEADRNTSGVVIISPSENRDLYQELTGFLPEGIEWEWDE